MWNSFGELVYTCFPVKTICLQGDYSDLSKKFLIMGTIYPKDSKKRGKNIKQNDFCRSSSTFKGLRPAKPIIN